jgi:hypothetical protein
MRAAEAVLLQRVADEARSAEDAFLARHVEPLMDLRLHASARGRLPDPLAVAAEVAALEPEVQGRGRHRERGLVRAVGGWGVSAPPAVTYGDSPVRTRSIVGDLVREHGQDSRALQTSIAGLSGDLRIAQADAAARRITARAHFATGT